MLKNAPCTLHLQRLILVAVLYAVSFGVATANLAAAMKASTPGAQLDEANGGLPSAVRPNLRSNFASLHS